jgi:hypothetical protein
VLTKKTNDDSVVMDTSSFNRYLTREIKSNIIENKLDDYVNSKRNEIYARMKLPKVLVNHYVTSANQTNMSVDQLPYDLFDSHNLSASKSKFEEESELSDGLSQPAYIEEFNKEDFFNTTMIKTEGEVNEGRRFKF